MGKNRRVFGRGGVLGASLLASVVIGGLAAGAHAVQRRRTAARRAAATSSASPFVASVDKKTVRRGDTLWALTSQVTGKPYVWPQIWALNPQLTNPHWIFPGDVVHFAPRRPTTLASRAHPRPHPRVLSSFDTTEADAPPIRRKKRSDGVQRVFGGSFVTTDEMQSSGCVLRAGVDRILLRAGDMLFVRFAEAPKVNDRLYLVRSLREVHHPSTGEMLGTMTEVTGEAVVRALLPADADAEPGPPQARIELVRTVREVERGQRVVPATNSLLRDVQLAGSAPNVQATVVDLEGDLLTAGNQKLVFIDRGQQDGLMRGQGLVVQSRGDPLAADAGEGQPVIDVAWLLVVDAKDNTSTCLVTEALREIWVGDVAVARSAATGSTDADAL
jgi:hypothetical protein